MDLCVPVPSVSNDRMITVRIQGNTLVVNPEPSPLNAGRCNDYPSDGSRVQVDSKHTAS